MDEPPLGLPECATLTLRRDGGRLHVTLDRPRARNALSSEMVAELGAVFGAIDASPRRGANATLARQIRCVILRGAGGVFSAGGDVRDLGAAGQSPPAVDDPLVRANRAFGTLLTRIDRAPQAVVCAAEGAALGGGLGLLCVCDVALATDSCRLGMPETRLGLVPAQIAPFVVRRIGLSQARRLAVTGVTFDGRAAREIGLVHGSYPDTAALEAALEKVVGKIERCGPQAIRATKRLFDAVTVVAHEELLDDAARELAALVRGAEAREGLAAFLEKRSPEWTA